MLVFDIVLTGGSRRDNELGIFLYLVGGSLFVFQSCPAIMVEIFRYDHALKECNWKNEERPTKRIRAKGLAMYDFENDLIEEYLNEIGALYARTSSGENVSERAKELAAQYCERIKTLESKLLMRNAEQFEPVEEAARSVSGQTGFIKP